MLALLAAARAIADVHHHASVYDVVIALAVPLNTALILALTAVSLRTHRKTKHVEKVLNGMVGPSGEPQKAIVEPVEPIAGGRRTYDPPSDTGGPTRRGP